MAKVAPSTLGSSAKPGRLPPTACKALPRARFEVRAKTTASGAAFSYRVVARRKDIAPARFAELTLPATSLQEVQARVAKAH
jgi:hypothetical protein